MRSAPVVAASILSCALLLLTTTSSHAQDEEEVDYARRGLYVGVQFDGFLDEYSGAIETFVNDYSGVRTSFDVDASFGASATIGYRLYRALAAEIQYSYVSELSGEMQIGIPDLADPLNPIRTISNDIDVRGHLATVNLKAIYPGWGRFQPYATGGIGLMGVALDAQSSTISGVRRLAIKDTVFAGRIGGGIDVYLTEHFLLNVGAGMIFTDFSAPGRSEGPEATALNLRTGFADITARGYPVQSSNENGFRENYSDPESGNGRNDSVGDFDHLYLWNFFAGVQFRF